MDSGDSAGLDRLRDLIADLGGPLNAGGGMLGWVAPGDLAAVPDEVYGVVGDAGLLADSDPRLQRAARLRTEVDPRLRQPITIPADADALMSRLWEIDETAAIGLLVSLAQTNPPRLRRQRMLRRRDEQDPEAIFAELAVLAGSGIRWWTNTDLTRWNQITQHTFDAIVVGAGNGIIMTLIAFDGGE